MRLPDGPSPDDLERFRDEYFAMLAETFGVDPQSVKLREEGGGSIRGTVPKHLIRRNGHRPEEMAGQEVDFLWDPILGGVFIDLNGNLKNKGGEKHG